MPAKGSGPGQDGLERQIAAYLKKRRLDSHLTQTALADQGRSLGVSFDHSWISQWERRGPKASVMKALVYLKLIGADFELIGEMMRAPIDWPREEVAPATALRSCAKLTSEGKFGGALGLALSAAATSGFAAKGYLAASIVATRAQLYAIAEHFGDMAVEESEDASTKAKSLIQLACVAARRGKHDEAADRLDAIPQQALEDTLLAAREMHAKAFVLCEKGDHASALQLLEDVLQKYPGEHAHSVTPRVLSKIAVLRAQLGNQHDALAAADEALKLSQRDGRVTDLATTQNAAHTNLLLNRNEAAFELLADAERQASQLAMPITLFEIRLQLLELANATGNEALSKMLTNRLRADRQHLALPPRLLRDYIALTSYNDGPDTTSR